MAVKSLAVSRGLFLTVKPDPTLFSLMYASPRKRRNEEVEIVTDGFLSHYFLIKNDTRCLMRDLIATLGKSTPSFKGNSGFLGFIISFLKVLKCDNVESSDQICKLLEIVTIQILNDLDQVKTQVYDNFCNLLTYFLSTNSYDFFKFCKLIMTNSKILNIYSGFVPKFLFVYLNFFLQPYSYLSFDIGTNFNVQEFSNILNFLADFSPNCLPILTLFLKNFPPFALPEVSTHIFDLITQNFEPTSLLALLVWYWQSDSSEISSMWNIILKKSNKFKLFDSFWDILNPLLYSIPDSRALTFSFKTVSLFLPYMTSPADFSGLLDPLWSLSRRYSIKPSLLSNSSSSLCLFNLFCFPRLVTDDVILLTEVLSKCFLSEFKPSFLEFVASKVEHGDVFSASSSLYLCIFPYIFDCDEENYFTVLESEKNSTCDPIVSKFLNFRNEPDNFDYFQEFFTLLPSEFKMFIIKLLSNSLISPTLLKKVFELIQENSTISLSNWLNLFYELSCNNVSEFLSLIPQSIPLENVLQFLQLQEVISVKNELSGLFSTFCE
ncbi:hypothetical protein GEMRC1_008904 [Eukaryota sp. GEM-RC1]